MAVTLNPYTMSNLESFINRFNAIMDRAIEAGLEAPDQEANLACMKASAFLQAAQFTCGVLQLPDVQDPTVIARINSSLNALDTAVTLQIATS